MRNIIWYFATAAGAGVLGFMGCSGQQALPPDSGTVGATSGLPPTTTAGTGGSAPDCTGIIAAAVASTKLPVPAGCGSCAEASCCSALSDCNNDADCASCIIGQGPNCATNALYISLGQCTTANCPVWCTLPNQCNPITNDGCGSDGSSCGPRSFLTLPFFSCYVPPNDAVLCGVCDDRNLSGPFCGGGLTCIENETTCSRYCCNDGDCGTGVCDVTQFPGLGVGACIVDPNAASPKSACDAPAIVPSGGACVTFVASSGLGGSSAATGNGGSGGSVSATGGSGGTGAGGSGGKGGAGGA